MIQPKRILFSVGLGVITLAILMVIINPFELDFNEIGVKFTGLFALNRTLNETEPLLESLQETTTTSVETTSTSSTTVLTTTSPGTTTTTTTTSTSTTTVPSANHVIFSEVFYDTPGTDSEEEWIELYNPTEDSIDISGLTIEDNGGTYTIPNGTIIADEEFLVISRDETGFENLYGFLPDLSGLSLGLNNGEDYLQLKNGSAVIDMVAWEGYSGWDLEVENAESIERYPPDKDTDSENDWRANADPDPDPGGLTATSTTTTTTSSTTTSSTTTTTTITVTTIPTVTGHVVISEFQVQGDNINDEFVELYNPTTNPVNLSTWSIQYKSATGTTYSKKNFGVGNIINGYGFFLIANNEYNGNVTPDLTHNSFQMAGSGGHIFLINSQILLNSSTDPSIMDKVGYGDANSPEGVACPAPGINQSMERKPGDSGLGNGWDNDNNLQDFISRDLSEPQNSTSGTETPG